MASCVWAPLVQASGSPHLESTSTRRSNSLNYVTNFRLVFRNPKSISMVCNRMYCVPKDKDSHNYNQSDRAPIQIYKDIERLLTETVKQSQGTWHTSNNWSEVEGAWVLRPRNSKAIAVVHFIGGIFVGAAPQLTYRFFLERLAEEGILVVATPYASGFDYFLIADEVQFKFDRCLRLLPESVQDLPTFGIGHSLGSVIHLLIGSRYAVQRNGNILMAFNNKEASLAIPLFSPVLLPVAQSIGPFLSQIASSPTIRLGFNNISLNGITSVTACASELRLLDKLSESYGASQHPMSLCIQFLKSKPSTKDPQAEMTMKQLENLSPSIMKQVLPLVEQLPPLYMDLVSGRENFTPRPEETKRLIRSYYAVSRNLLIKFKEDMIDETSTLAKVLSSDSSISSMLDMSIRLLPGDHGLPLQQALPDVPPAMADAVNRGGEFLATLTSGTPWETVAKEVSSTLGARPEPNILRADVTKDINLLVNVIMTWLMANTGPRVLKP